MNGESKQLDASAQARAEAMRSLVLAEIPDAVPFIRELHQAGLIDGWRNVSYVGPPRGPVGISAREYLENSNA